MGPREADPAARLAADYDVRQLFRSRSRAHWGRDTLQTFKDAASQTLVPMTAMTTAVDALGKGISEGNSGLAQGLENIGLSFHAIATITYARRFACDAQRVEMERSRRNSGLQIVPQAAWVNPSDACVLNFGNSCAVMNVAAA